MRSDDDHGYAQNCLRRDAVSFRLRRLIQHRLYWLLRHHQMILPVRFPQRSPRRISADVHDLCYVYPNDARAGRAWACHHHLPTLQQHSCLLLQGCCCRHHCSTHFLRFHWCRPAVRRSGLTGRRCGRHGPDCYADDCFHHVLHGADFPIPGRPEGYGGSVQHAGSSFQLEQDRQSRPLLVKHTFRKPAGHCRVRDRPAHCCQNSEILK